MGSIGSPKMTVDPVPLETAAPRPHFEGSLQSYGYDGNAQFARQYRRAFLEFSETSRQWFGCLPEKPAALFRFSNPALRSADAWTRFASASTATIRDILANETHHSALPVVWYNQG